MLTKLLGYNSWSWAIKTSLSKNEKMFMNTDTLIRPKILEKETVSCISYVYI